VLDAQPGWKRNINGCSCGDSKFMWNKLSVVGNDNQILTTVVERFENESARTGDNG
jgi:hypothetical protein